MDTHIRRIAHRQYLDDAQAAPKSLTPAAYARIGDDLRARFGPMAGWAQQYLFFHDVYLQGTWSTYAALMQPQGEPIRVLEK